MKYFLIKWYDGCAEMAKNTGLASWLFKKACHISKGNTQSRSRLI